MAPTLRCLDRDWRRELCDHARHHGAFDCLYDRELIPVVTFAFDTGRRIIGGIDSLVSGSHWGQVAANHLRERVNMTHVVLSIPAMSSQQSSSAFRSTTFSAVLAPLSSGLHLALGEGDMTGQLRMERGQLYDLLTLLARNTEQRTAPNWTAGFDTARFLIRGIMQFNPVVRARRNVAHQYDIDSAIYDLFLDRDRQYSCGYFANSIADLHEVQLAKKRHVAAKLALGHLSSFRA